MKETKEMETRKITQIINEIITFEKTKYVAELTKKKKRRVNS
jgi:hypothetical protein